MLPLFLGTWFLLLQWHVVRCEFMKIHVDSSHYRLKRADEKSDRNLCKVLKKVDKKDFHLPDKFKDIDPFWLRTDVNVTLWRGDPVLPQRWDEVYQMPVRGVGDKNLTVGDVMKHFTDEGCLIVPWGGGPRDVILGAVLHDVDAEVSCSFKKAYQVCVDYVGEKSCEIKSSVVRVGHPDEKVYNGPTLDQYDFGCWNCTFTVPPEKWEFTPNSMGYHDGFILDMSGMGVDDVCAKKVRIPTAANRENWVLWTDFSGRKLLRFWKLKQKGYTAYDNATEKFLVDTYRSIGNPETIRLFYCVYVMDAEYRTDERRCKDYKPSDQCTNCKIFANNFQNDFGDYWSRDMVPPLQDMVYGKQNCSLQRSIVP